MERNSSNIQFYVRKNEKNLIEIVEAYEIDKIKIGFRSYGLDADPGSRVKSGVDFYMPIAEFELLCHNLLTGNISSRLKKGEKIDTIYKGSPRDGQVYSRTLSFRSSNRGIFFNVTEGPGKKNESGLVKPLYTLEEAPSKVSISLNNDEIKSFALQGKRACDVYYARLANASSEEKILDALRKMLRSLITKMGGRISRDESDGRAA